MNMQYSQIFRTALLFICLYVPGYSQIKDGRFHTYSIVARDPETGEMGVAVQSHWFSVGTSVSWAEAGVGAIATQSFVNVSYGTKGLDLLRQGKTAGEVVEILTSADEGRDVRQLAVVDKKGNVAAYTGSRCIPEAGHSQGENFSVQANMMLQATVWPAMAEAFQNSKGPLAERMIAALSAAEKEGGDIRGRQSAAILIVRGESTGKIWEDRLIDLRVEDHPYATKELERLLKLHRAYAWMNEGDLAIEKNNVEGALEAYGRAESLFPDNLEMRYWHAVSLVNVGMQDRAFPIFQEIFRKDANWRLLTERLPGVGLIQAGPGVLEKILSLPVGKK